MRSPRPSRRLRAAIARRDGATALEFGLIGVSFCLLLFGVIEVSRYYYTYQAVRTVVAEAARRVQVDETLGTAGTQVCQTGTAIDANVMARTPLNPTGLTVCYTRTVMGTLTTVQVTGNYSFQFVSIPVLNAFLGSNTRTISERTQTVY